MADTIQQSNTMRHTPEVERALASLSRPLVDIRDVKPSQFDQTNWSQLSKENVRRQTDIAVSAAKQKKGAS